jgi:hypothetical protein
MEKLNGKIFLSGNPGGGTTVALLFDQGPVHSGG